MRGRGEKEAKTRKGPLREKKKKSKGDLENTKTHPPKTHPERKVPSGVRQKKVNRKKVSIDYPSDKSQEAFKSNSPHFRFFNSFSGLTSLPPHPG